MYICMVELFVNLIQIDQKLIKFHKIKLKKSRIYNNFFYKYIPQHSIILSKNIIRIQEIYMQPEQKIKGSQMHEDQNLQEQYIIKQEENHQIQKQLLRNIGCDQIKQYLTKRQVRKKLGYPQACCQQLQGTHLSRRYSFKDMVGLDCQLIQTNVGDQLYRVIIINLGSQILYDQWFDVKQGTHITDMQTHITGIDQEKYKTYMKDKPAYSVQDRSKIQQIIKDKIVVGHDLVNNIKILGITHQIFIDTVDLMPHSFGLPYKNKLKDIGFEYLNRHIRWDSQNPFEDSLCALEVTKKHISQGRGTIEIQPAQEIDYTIPNTPTNIDFQRIIKDAQLDINKILLFVLRGSRALDIQIKLKEYTSDWDYVVVYDTDSQIDGRLIKLPNIDISFFDKHSFQKHLYNNDISYLEIFFLPEKYKFINKIEFPYLLIDLIKFRGMLGFHLNKSRLKIKRFSKDVAKIQYKWKILKAHHLQIRFSELFLQINEIYRKYYAINEEQIKGKQIQYLKEKLKQVDIKKMNSIWDEVYQQFKEKHNYEDMILKLQKIQMDKMTIVTSVSHKTKGLGYKGEVIKENKKNGNKEQKIMKQDSNLGKIKNKKQKNPIHAKLETVKFLKNHPTSQLQNFKVICKKHKFYPNLIQLHYMQSADFSHTIAYQCRGLILDTQNQYEVIALPYYKFYDYNDPKYSEFKKFDWDSIKVYDKKDGSIAFMYYYEGKWNVASSTIPDGTNDYCYSQQQTTIQFSKQFWNIFFSLGFKLPNVEDQNKTFVFQLMSKNHIIVVKRTASQLCLHGVRDITTLEEQDHIKYAQKYNWIVNRPLQIPKQQLNIQSLVKRVQNMDPLKNEGYVVCDKNWTRMKIKCSNYVRISWLGELNLGHNKDPKKFILMEIILTGEAEVFCKYCPDWQKITKQLLGKIKLLNDQVIEAYQKIQDLPQRQFASQIKKHDKTFQSFLFALRKQPEKYYGKIQTVLTPKNFSTYIQSYK